MATDIKELYPGKVVTLVHSRDTLMHNFHRNLHDIIESRCRDLGVHLQLGSRVKVPPQGYPTDGSIFDVGLDNGKLVPADFAVSLVGIRYGKLTIAKAFLRSSALDKCRSRASYHRWTRI